MSAVPRRPLLCLRHGARCCACSAHCTFLCLPCPLHVAVPALLAARYCACPAHCIGTLCSITDAISDPPNTEQTYVEELLRLPGCFLCYSPMQGPPPVAPAPCRARGYVTFGSFNALAKVTDDVIAVRTSCLLFHDSSVPLSRISAFRRRRLCCVRAAKARLARATGWRR